MRRMCRSCGRRFTITVAELTALRRIAQVAGWTNATVPGRCLSCRRESRRIRTLATEGPDLARRCVTCGDRFTITTGERAELHARGYHLRRRCSACLRAGHGAGAAR